MLQKPMQVIRVISSPDNEYGLGGKNTVSLIPSIVIAYMKPNSGHSSSNDACVGFEVHSADGQTLCRKFWEIQPPVKPRQAIRGLKLLEKCPCIEDDTLCACYYAASRELNETANHYIDSLKSSGFTNVERYREQILNDSSTDDFELKKLTDLLSSNDIKFDSND